MISYLLATLVLVVIATIVGLALNMQWGLGGLINFGLFGFYMLGAYTSGLLSLQGVPPLAAFAGAIVLTALVSAAVSLISIRLSEDYLAIVTLGFAECLRLFISYEEWLTRGTLGIADIHRPFGGWVGERYGDALFLGFAVLCLAVIYAVLEVLARAPFGRTLRATRDDPAVAEALGKNVLLIRVTVFALGGAALGAAGSLHAFYYTYIDPTQFGTTITAYAFMAVIIGGRGSNLGVLIAGFSVVFLLEASRFLVDYIAVFDGAQLAAIRLFLVGAGLVAALIIKPGGLIREYRLRVAVSRRHGTVP